jgi:hypothetical protein
VADAQIAAICRTIDATLATRNTDGFEETGIELINRGSWADASFLQADRRACLAPSPDTGQGRACSAAFGDNGCQAVAVTADRCSAQYRQLRSGSVGTTQARLSSPPDRLDATWPTSHSTKGAPHSPRARAA